MTNTLDKLDELEKELRQAVESREHTVRRLSNDRRLDKFIPLRVDELLDEALSTFPHDTEEDTIVRVITRLEREDAEINPVKLPRLGPDADQTHPTCLLYTSPSPRDRQKSRMPSSA